LTHVALKHMDSIGKELQKRIWKKLHWFGENLDNLNLEPLNIPFDGFYKLRIGDIRVMYTIDTNTKIVTVHTIKPRDKAYK